MRHSSNVGRVYRPGFWQKAGFRQAEHERFRFPLALNAQNECGVVCARDCFGY